MTRSLRASHGQVSVEWLGVIAVVAALVLALVSGIGGVGGKVVDGIDDAICTITGGDCGGADDGSPSAADGEGEPDSQESDPAPESTDPNLDSDEDGIPDRAEKETGTKPDKADSDDDGLTDGEELAIGTDPNDKDSDGAGGSTGDGLTDAEEIELGTDPTVYDSDGDFYCDGCEVKDGDDPLKDERYWFEKIGDEVLDNPFDYITPGSIAKSAGKGIIEGVIKKVAPKLKGLKKGASLADRAKARREKLEALRRGLKDKKAAQDAPGCLNSFLPGTPVLMADGTTTPIEQIAIGDRVLATGPLGQTAGFPVTDLMTDVGEKYLVRITAGGRTTVATQRHPYYLAGEQRWTDAGSLAVGDRLRSPDGSYLVVEAVRRFASPRARVHNLTVQTAHTYYAGSEPVLVHNAKSKDDCDTGKKPPRKEGKAERKRREAAEQRERERKEKEKEKEERGEQDEPEKRERDKTGPNPPPEALKAFPDTTPARRKKAVQGGGSLRARWKDKDGNIYEHDRKKDTIEIYDPSGKRHKGEFNHETGEQVGPPVKGRTTPR